MNTKKKEKEGTQENKILKKKIQNMSRLLKVLVLHLVIIQGLFFLVGGLWNFWIGNTS
jgi:cell division protein FtsL